MQGTRILIIIFIAFALVSCEGDNAISSNNINSDVTLKQYLENIDFSGSVLFKKDGKDIIRESFGYADKSNSIPNSNNTLYRIGSVSKGITALAVQKIKERGYLESFSQTIGDFVEEFPFGNKLQIHQLLNHKSGFPDLVPTYEKVIIENDVIMTREDILDSYLDEITENDFLFEPGTKHHYSNTNYFLLANLVEELSGEDFHTFLRNEIFNPLSMNNTTRGNNSNLANSMAKGYLNGVENYEYPMQIAFGSGDLISNISDLEKWLNFWANSAPKELVDEFIPTPNDIYTEFGYGWFSYILEGKRVNFHGGDINGFTSLIAYYPEENAQLIILSNEENKRTELDQILDLLIINNFK